MAGSPLCGALDIRTGPEGAQLRVSICWNLVCTLPVLYLYSICMYLSVIFLPKIVSPICRFFQKITFIFESCGFLAAKQNAEPSTALALFGFFCVSRRFKKYPRCSKTPQDAPNMLLRRSKTPPRAPKSLPRTPRHDCSWILEAKMKPC